MATVTVQFGGKQGQAFSLETSRELVVVRTRDRRPIAETPLSGGARQVLDRMEFVTAMRAAGVEVLHVRSRDVAEGEAARAQLNAEPAIHFAGRALSDIAYRSSDASAAEASRGGTAEDPVLYSENLFVRFDGAVSARAARRLLAARSLTVKRPVRYVHNGYFVQAPDGIGLGVFELALELLHGEETVELCHPELLRPRSYRGALGAQWHLGRVRVGTQWIDQHASVEAAWKHSTGKGTTIAVIDTGIDVDHEEFARRGKIVAPFDATDGALDPGNPRPQHSREEHGTACAGVACADGKHGASGVAPEARLMPIRLVSGLGSQGEADAIAWAADNGADVISCSWGPRDGRWWDPMDAAHGVSVPLPDSTRLAIEYALASGRGGRGSVICWAAGNGNESVDGDGYASHPGVIAVAACNDRGTRSVYSDTGRALWCAFPSDDAELQPTSPNPPPSHGGVWGTAHPAPLTPGIWTTDWSGPRGYNVGGSTAQGDAAGHYTSSFGGTSSATPGVAGVVALILSLDKTLTSNQVKDLLRRACDPIDTANGQYDATGHSPLYGYGRLNALKAVQLAAPRAPTRRSGRRSRRTAKKP